MKVDNLVSQLIDYFGPTRRLYSLSKAKRLTKQFEASDRSSLDAEYAKFPPGERVECPSIWMAELFTPSTLKGLNKGLKIFDEEKFSTPSSKLEKWLKDTREGKSAGWINLHTVSLDKTYNQDLSINIAFTRWTIIQMSALAKPLINIMIHDV